jgi:hydroxymethylbilane synthase
VPLAAYAVWRGDVLHLRGCVSTIDARRVLRAEGTARAPGVADAIELGRRVSADLEAQGAMEIVRELSTTSGARIPPAAAQADN